VAQITNVTSESLQAKIRQLLPSQQGFGEDLQAQNVIVPIIDLTSTAEGSSVPEMLQTALAFGSQTEFTTTNTTDLVASTPGFYRIIGTSTIFTVSSLVRLTQIIISDGTTLVKVWKHQADAASGANPSTTTFDFNVFLRSGDSLNVSSSDTDTVIAGSTRQIADVNGVLVNPSGFTPQ
jgi:hypothetical protein